MNSYVVDTMDLILELTFYEFITECKCIINYNLLTLTFFTTLKIFLSLFYQIY